MKNLFTCGILAVGIGVCTPRFGQAQGTTTYLTSIGPSVTTQAVGSDSWVAAAFRTGNNPGGYDLNSIQLEMAAATGQPSGFTVQLYGPASAEVPNPGSSLATLSGSTDPATAGVYTFTASDVPLTPDAQYFIVLTSATQTASGLYAWGLENPSSNISSGNDWTEGAVTFQSSDGSSWSGTYSNDPQFALTATAVPEPDTIVLMGLPALLHFAWRRWRANAQPHSAG